MAVTLKDIAEKAQVSISTVSRIINNDQTKPASKETTDKVWKIVRELGYVPNLNARSLIKGQEEGEGDARTKAIGCIFTSTRDTYNDPFFSQIARGIQAEAAKRGYVMGYSFSSCDMNESALYNNVTANRVDGAIVLGRFDQEFLAFLKNNIKNLVYAGLNYVNAGFDEIICDAYKAVASAIEHLIGLGHINIGYIGSIPGTQKINVVNEHRFEAFQDTMRKHGIEVCEGFVRNIELCTEEGYKGMKELLKCSNRPSAVFAANDVVAIGVMKAIHEEGLRIPEDIAVMGLDDIDIAAYLRPGLTTIHVPKEELGKFAVKMLIDRIENGHDLPVRVDLPFELVVRESCGASKVNDEIPKNLG
ncbi:substrate-binding domain-containing protein [Petroclostridium sp. X23]|uniref:LacI family DNA-binding transcriptional regulator n=1 Tax=Petroclostridium sp. X23 TaxID=3045146 RepID=UPI0024ADCD8A|nr:substrate-binding domain-containing protein [Petroclostridium sp. X23]WHH56853.1 substrate-binding domain-containing protein [Petroclostridium sp. X23]